MNLHHGDTFPVSHDQASEVAPQRTQAIRPEGKGHWEQVKPVPLPDVPDLPENPTEEQRAAYVAACHANVQARIDNCSVIWVPDPEPNPGSKPLATLDRERPPVHPLPAGPEGVNLNRHEAQCSVCQHPHREAIEEEFLNWMSPRAIADDYEIDFRAIYRHAHAFNLIAARNRRIRGVLSLVLERAEHVPTPTADAIVRAVRAFTRVNDDGQWVEPPSHVIVSSGSRQPSPNESGTHSIDISSNAGSDSSNFRRKSIPRRAANLASSQLHENTHPRTSYPETHFQHRSRRKIKTKAKQSRCFKRIGGSK